MQATTEQVHNNLKNLLLNGRIMVNGLPLTANEIVAVIQGEQMLYEKAIQLDKATELVAKQSPPTELPEQPGKTVKIPVDTTRKD